MKKYTKEEVLRQYEESGKIMYESALNGNYRAGNREAEKLIEIFKYFENNREFAFECIKDMIRSDNVVVRTKAAEYCLTLNENIDEAVAVLTDIRDKKENGIFAFAAKMSLEVWNKRGYLLVYTKEEK